MPRLSDDELQSVPQQLPGWTVTQGALQKSLSFHTFGDAIAFVNRVADVAEEVGHYPQLLVAVRIVTLRLVTPDEGVTERDVYLARRINALRGR
ncbi:MAG: 4a-hydroxytetrahydrobiopterin dehydratase [Gammaproteobacteria bacterium]|nr:4a-hydroxytetrahydrobiopterin dehydratase [Gammaproteobacteria bacterium]